MNKTTRRAVTALLILFLGAFAHGTGARAHAVTATRHVRPDIGVSFRTPSGFREVRTSRAVYRAERPNGVYILVRLVLTDETATGLPWGAAAAAFPNLHDGTSGRVINQEPAGFSVDGALTSLVTMEHVDGRILRQTCQILTLMNGRVCQFEYSAPAGIFPDDLRAFSDMIGSVRWLTAEQMAAQARRTKRAASPVRPVRFRQVLVPRRGAPAQKLWVYIPENRGGGRPPCVVLAPGADHLYYGVDLSAHDKKEYLAYAQAGFAVVAFAVDGTLKNDGSNDDEYNAAKAFKAAHGGLANARIAIDYALNKIKVDPLRLYVAGRKSAGTLALQVAENDPRVTGCVAFAPCVDVEAGLARALPVLDGDIPGFRRYVKRYSPKNRIQELRCPVFLFHPGGDRRYAPQQTRAFAARAKMFNPDVTYVAAAGAGDATFREGIPQAVAWLRSVSARR